MLSTFHKVLTDDLIYIWYSNIEKAIPKGVDKQNERENWFVVFLSANLNTEFLKSLKNLSRSIQQIQIRNYGLPNPFGKKIHWI